VKFIERGKAGTMRRSPKKILLFSRTTTNMFMTLRIFAVQRILSALLTMLFHAAVESALKLLGVIRRTTLKRVPKMKTKQTPNDKQSKRTSERTKAKHIAELRSLKRDVVFLQQNENNSK
jgi:hypothetical protein